MSQISSPYLLCRLVLIGLICTGAAAAQMDPANPQAKPTETPSEATTKTRARQVVKPGTDKGTDKSIDKSVDKSADAAAKPAEKTAAKATSQLSEDPSFAPLRDQISAATSEEERTRLRIQLADQLADGGKKDDAIAELHLLIADERFDPVGLYNIGNRLVRLRDDAGAIFAYRKAIEQRKGNFSRAFNNLGFLFLQQGQWDLSYDALMSALRLEGFRYAEASYNLGRLYAARGENDLATREWRRALAVNPQHAGAALALRENRDGNVTIANKSASMPAGAGQVNPDKTQPAATTRALALDRTSYDLLQRARTARDQGRNGEAVEAYRSLLSRTDGYFAPASLELAYALITLKRNDEAVAMLQAVSTKDGARYPIAYFHLARVYESQGQLKLAEENYNRVAVAYAGDNIQFLLDLSRVRDKLGDFTGALAALEQYVQASERAGRRPDWADERLGLLRQKVSGSSAGAAKN